MVIHPSGLIGALHERLPDLLPAHAIHGVMTAEYADDDAFADRRRGDYVYVQGRGDRIHAFLCVSAADDPALYAFGECDANWRWLVAWDDDVSPPIEALAGERGFGLIAVPRDGELTKLRDAAPNPGIFIKKYPALRKHWRTLSSW